MQHNIKHKNRLFEDLFLCFQIVTLKIMYYLYIICLKKVATVEERLQFFLLER